MNSCKTVFLNYCLICTYIPVHVQPYLARSIKITNLVQCSNAIRNGMSLLMICLLTNVLGFWSWRCWRDIHVPETLYYMTCVSFQIWCSYFYFIFSHLFFTTMLIPLPLGIEKTSTCSYLCAILEIALALKIPFCSNPVDIVWSCAFSF